MNTFAEASGRLPLLGHYLTYRSNPLAFISGIQHKSNAKVVQFLLGTNRVWLVRDWSIISEIFGNAHEVFAKGFGNEILRPAIGGSLFFSEGEEWQFKKQVLLHAFGSSGVSESKSGIRTTVRLSLDETDSLLAANAPMSFAHIQCMTMRVLGKVLLGREFLHDHPVHRAVEESWQLIEESSKVFGRFWMAWRGKKKKTWDSHRNYLENLSREVLFDTRDSCLMDLTELQDLDRRQRETFIDDVVSFLIAGRECIAVALFWVLDNLRQQPKDWQSRVDKDCGKARTLFIKETLRLYPPIWMMARQANRGYEFDGLHCKKGQIVFISPYAVHRDPLYWSDPEKFQPERFQQSPAQGYLPFARGPRACIGQGLAMSILRLFLDEILQSNREIHLSKAVGVQPGLSLRPLIA